MSGFFASRASSVVKRVFGKRMKIFDLQKADKEIPDGARDAVMPAPTLYSPSNNTLPSQFVFVCFVA